MLTMVSLETVSFCYPNSEQPVFSNLSLTVKKGSWVVLVGPDGSGKTTLCKLVKGLLQPTSGSIAFSDCRGQGSVGYLGGDPYDSLVGISVAEDVIFGLENLNLSQHEMKRRLEEALRRTGLSGMEERLVHTLSGGEQQKLALAGALAEGIDVLVIDEAFNMLDKVARNATRDLLSMLRKERMLTIVEAASCHFESEADRIIFLSDGKIVSDSTVDAFVSSELGSRWLRLTGGIQALRRGLADMPDCLSALEEIIKRRRNIKK
jgi:energy-coupling factor transport system ATP-binding protein